MQRSNGNLHKSNINLTSSFHGINSRRQSYKHT